MEIVFPMTANPPLMIIDDKRYFSFSVNIMRSFQ